MTLLDRDTVAGCLRQLPSLPAAIHELLLSFDNEEVDISEISRRIALDQGLAARVLRVANSSFYGLQSKVGTINEAVVVLGFRAVRSMVLAIGINHVFHVEHCPGFNSHGYLRHGVGVALAARGLAVLSGRHPDLAFTGGLLHDLGQLALAANFPAQYARALAYRAQHDCFLTVAERDVLGIDHAEVGGLLAQTWRFPPSLHDALADHHAPAAAAGQSLADLIHVADAIAHGLSLAGSDEELVMPIDRTAWERLGLDSAQITAVLPQVMAGMEETCLALS